MQGCEKKAQSGDAADTAPRAATAPNSAYDITDEKTVDISRTGGIAQLGALTVVVGEGAVTTDFKIKISRIAQSVFKGQADGISADDESYMIELLTANGAALKPEDLLQALTVTMKHQIRNLREEIKVLIITNFSEPSESWERFFVSFEQLIIAPQLHLSQVTSGALVTVSYQIKATHLLTQVVEACAGAKS